MPLLLALLMVPPASAEDTQLFERVWNTRHPERIAARLDRRSQHHALRDTQTCARGIASVRANGTVSAGIDALASCPADERAAACSRFYVLSVADSDAAAQSTFGRLCSGDLPNGDGQALIALANVGSDRATAVKAEVEALNAGHGRAWADGTDGPSRLLAVGLGAKDRTVLYGALDGVRLLADLERLDYALALNGLRDHLGALGQVDAAMAAGVGRVWHGVDVVAKVSGDAVATAPGAVLGMLDRVAKQGKAIPTDAVLRGQALGRLGRWEEAEAAVRDAYTAKLPGAGDVLARAIGEQAYALCNADGIHRVERAWQDGLDAPAMELAAGCYYEHTRMDLTTARPRTWISTGTAKSNADKVLAQVNAVRKRSKLPPLEAPTLTTRALAAYDKCLSLDEADARCRTAALRLGLHAMFTLDYTPGVTAITLKNMAPYAIRVDAEGGDTKRRADIEPGASATLSLPAGPVFVFASCNGDEGDRRRLRQGEPLVSLYGVTACSVKGATPNREFTGADLASYTALSHTRSLNWLTAGSGYWLVGDLLPTDTTLHWSLVE